MTSSSPARDLSGKTALVTGASSGIGLEACVVLARRGARVLMVARDQARGDAARADVARRSGSSSVELLMCDFASQAAIRALAEEVRSRTDRLDILVNNAGSVSPKRQLTEDGIEQTFAVNHLGYFLLTNLLLDLLIASAPARIVNVSSIGHRQGTLDFDDLGFERGYGIMKAYSRSKLANVLFTTELARRLDGKGVTVNALHPGAVATHIWSHAPGIARPFLAIAKLFMITPAEGGDRIVYLATSPEVEGKTGGYYEKNRLVTPARRARDPALASRLWSVSAQLVHLT
ncbi:MAG TPA: SDR family oxidoreductase [Kofleriaceae bacterium]|nr:SDR family oxidoreductase [Kofleriaceae bacterium]